jgi:hypothetical protein
MINNIDEAPKHKVERKKLNTKSIYHFFNLHKIQKINLIFGFRSQKWIIFRGEKRNRRLGSIYCAGSAFLFLTWMLVYTVCTFGDNLLNFIPMI